MSDGRRTRNLLGAAVIVVLALAVAGAASLGGRSGRGTVPGSSFRADESGLLGARRLLEELGHRVESRRGAKLPDGTGHLLIRVEAMPGADRDMTPDEELRAAGRQLDEWVVRGNSALLVGAASPRGSGWPAILRRDGATPPSQSREDEWRLDGRDPVDALARLYGGDRPVVSPHDGIDVTEESTLQGPGDPWISELHFVLAPADADVLATAPSERGPVPVVVEARRGQGRIVLVADPFFLSNVRLAGSDNAAWLAVLVARLRGSGPTDSAVWFDDRAVGQAASRGVMSLFAEAGLGMALVAGAVLVLVGWWRAGPSDAPDRHVREVAAYRPESFALLRADLYADCLTGEDARRMVEDEVARRLGRGDAAGCERALTMLAARDPARVARIRGALERLPDRRYDTPGRRPDAWCAAIAEVWRALAKGDGEKNRAEDR